MTDSAPPGDRLAEAAALAEEIRERNRLVPDDDPRKVLLGHLDWLVGEVERLRGLLARLEWAGSYASAPGDDAMWAACPVCGARMQYDERRHQADCWLAAELHPERKEAPPPK